MKESDSQLIIFKQMMKKYRWMCDLIRKPLG